MHVKEVVSVIISDQGTRYYYRMGFTKGNTNTNLQDTLKQATKVSTSVNLDCFSTTCRQVVCQQTVQHVVHSVVTNNWITAFNALCVYHVDTSTDRAKHKLLCSNNQLAECCTQHHNVNAGI